MATLIAAVLVASLLGSLHCAGMCGPFAAFAVLTPGGPDSRPLRLGMAYNGGRLISYSLLGATAGLLGATLDLGGSMVGLQRAAAILAGAFMTAIGAVTVLRMLGVRFPLPSPARALGGWIRRGHASTAAWSPAPRALAIGLLTALLPCGWLYAFVVAAAGTGDPLRGAITLAAFWMGTLPILAAVGAGARRLAGSSGQRVQLLASILVMAFGIFSIIGVKGLPFGKAPVLAEPPATMEQAIERVESLRGSEPPCCRHDP